MTNGADADFLQVLLCQVREDNPDAGAFFDDIPTGLIAGGLSAGRLPHAKPLLCEAAPL